jgi:hypothetical protein
MHKNIATAVLAGTMLASCASTTQVEKTAKESPQASDIVFRSLWTHLADKQRVGTLGALSYAFCDRDSSPCKIQVKVTAKGDGCELEIKPEVMVVTHSDVELTWTIVGASGFEFRASSDVNFHKHFPGRWRWRDKAPSPAAITGIDGYDANDVHQYDVSVHPNGIGIGKGCGTDPIIVNTG